MNNIQKSIGALINSCFLMFNINAIQDQKSSEVIQNQNYCCKIVKYPDFNRAIRIIDIEVIYNGKKERIDGIYLYLSMLSRDKGLSKYNIVKRVKDKFPKIPADLSEKLAEYCYTEAEERFLQHFTGHKNS